MSYCHSVIVFIVYPSSCPSICPSIHHWYHAIETYLFGGEQVKFQSHCEINSVTSEQILTKLGTIVPGKIQHKLLFRGQKVKVIYYDFLFPLGIGFLNFISVIINKSIWCKLFLYTCILIYAYEFGIWRSKSQKSSKVSKQNVLAYTYLI